MIGVGKTSSRPSKDGYIHVFKRSNNVVPVPLRIGYRGVLANPNPIVDATAQMLGKVPVNILADNGFRAIRVKKNTGLRPSLGKGCWVAGDDQKYNRQKVFKIFHRGLSI
jgi:hypothetical protein